MKIVHIIPGTGGSFYCENCVRDGGLVKALREMGHDVVMVPMYLPLVTDEPGLTGDTPIFFGAVNVYLKQKFPFLKKLPNWLLHFFDSKSMLKLAASQAGSTRAYGLEEMTISMLKGEHGNQQEELEQLVTWLEQSGKPDVVYLANALLIGLARKIKERLKVPVVCALQDEDTWLDTMKPEYEHLIWEIMNARAKDVDMFIPVSHFYADKITRNLHVAKAKSQVVHIGIDITDYQPTSLPFDPPVIGYLSRLTESLGLGILVDAFLLLRKDNRFKNVKLYVTGGKTHDDDKFIKKIEKKLATQNALQDFQIFYDFDRPQRIDFLKSLTVLSVPKLVAEAFGTFQIEALAAGVPVVQPKIGAFPEIIEMSGGGVIYEPNTPEKLAEALAEILSSPENVKNLSQKGLETVKKEFCHTCMAGKIAEVYHKVTHRN